VRRSKKGLLPWAWVDERLASAHNYWVASTRPDGRPHCCPVWAIWLDGAVYFSTARESRKGRNLASNPHAAVHLDSGDEAVILEGRVEEVANGAPLDRIVAPYTEKYGMPPPLEDLRNVVYGLRPSLVLAWREGDFPHSATRWRFE
jgi:hypothetical protein